MVPILKKEFLDMFRGLKALIIVILFIGTSYFSSNYVSDLGLLGSAEESAPILAGLRLLIMLLGFLFITTMSHDVMNRDVESQTIRLLVTRTSRQNIVLGKFCGIFLFWVLVLVLSFIPLMIAGGKPYLLEFLQLAGYMAYASALTVLISILVTKSKLSMLVALIVSIAFPAIGMWATLQEGAWHYLAYAFPVLYLIKSNFLIVVPLLIAGMLVTAAILLFERRDL